MLVSCEKGKIRRISPSLRISFIAELSLILNDDANLEAQLQMLIQTYSIAKQKKEGV